MTHAVKTMPIMPQVLSLESEKPDPANVMAIPELAPATMALLVTKVMVADVELDLTGLARVIARFNELLPLTPMAGNVPLVQVSRMLIPSEVVAAATFAIAACSEAGLMNLSKINVTATFAESGNP